MAFNFQEVAPDNFAEDLRRAAGYKPFLLEDAKTVLARYGDQPANITRGMSDEYLHQRAVGKVIEWWKKQKAEAAQTRINQLDTSTLQAGPAYEPPPPPEGTPPPNMVGGSRSLTTTEQTQPTQVESVPTFQSQATTLAPATLARVLAQYGAPLTLVPPPSALVNEAALKNWLIQRGYTVA